MFRDQALRFVLFACLTASFAGATTITYSGDDPTRSFDIWFRATYQSGDQLLNGQTANSTQSIDVNVTAGITNLLIDGLYTVDAVCVDFFTLIGDGTYGVNLLGPDAVTNGTRVAWMLRNTLPTINTQSNLQTKREMAAGFQLAVWDIITDGGDGLAAGRIQSSQSTPTNAQVSFWTTAFLAGTAGQSLAEGIVYRNVAGSSSSQTLMSDSIPEPSTYALVVTGGVLLGLRRRRSVA